MYGIYVRIIITIILFIFVRSEYLSHIDFLFGLIVALWIFLPAIIGSYLGKKA